LPVFLQFSPESLDFHEGIGNILRLRFHPFDLLRPLGLALDFVDLKQPLCLFPCSDFALFVVVPSQAKPERDDQGGDGSKTPPKAEAGKPTRKFQ
jgi:hypothetical protein